MTDYRFLMLAGLAAQLAGAGLFAFSGCLFRQAGTGVSTRAICGAALMLGGAACLGLAALADSHFLLAAAQGVISETGFGTQAQTLHDPASLQTGAVRLG